MAREDRHRWEERYGSGRRSATEVPSEFLRAHAHLLAGRVLDVAAGAGRNALFLARRGLTVEALDISLAGLRLAREAARAEGLTLLAAQVDLESFPLARRRYDAIVNIRYLQRSLFLPMRHALKPGAILLFETFLLDQQALSAHRTAAYLLQRGELRAAFSDFNILVYEEGLYETSSGPSYLARMIARAPSNRPD
ncbi:MAG: class I SAM-dependent methyltransferase [Candidatus Binatia bacterium]